MPVVRLSTGTLTGTADVGGVPLIPGVTPGGASAGRDKPAMLINDFGLEISDMAHDNTQDFDVVAIYLKLSQETDLTPGLLLKVAEIGMWNTAATAENVTAMYRYTERLHLGTVWAPRMVGLRVIMSAGVSAFDGHVDVNYDRITIPWTEWFVRWDFLDNITDNAVQY